MIQRCLKSRPNCDEHRSPGIISGTTVRTSQPQASRGRESKIRKSIKTVTPVKTATSIYAQMLRWSFGATLLVTAIMVGLIYLAWQSGDASVLSLRGSGWSPRRLHEHFDPTLQLRGISTAG